MSFSLHITLNDLAKFGTIELRAEEGRHRPGEGRYYYNSNPVQILADQKAPPRGCNTDVEFDVPHDIAWCPVSKTLLAFAPSQAKPFEDFDNEKEAAAA